MIISYVLPYELTQTPMFADTEKDFEKIVVNTSGYVDSNKFLISLWNQVNTHICPNHCVNRAPWAYFPGKFIGKKSIVSVLGFCQTTIGELYFALEYHRKGDIDSLLVMRPTNALKHDEIKKLRLIVNKAKDNINNTLCYLCKAKIIAKLKNIRFTEYSASNFCIMPCDEGFNLCFYINAIDKFEAGQQALERLYEICAFLTVETNIYCSFEEFIVTKNELLPIYKNSGTFIEDYIDYYPAIDNWQICISSYAYKFINDNILSIGRFENRNEIEKFFLAACKHLQIGVETELRIGDVAIASIPHGTFALTPRDKRNKIEYMTSSLMSYLSAVECVTATDANNETCKECGAVIYKIANRVRNLSTEFLGDHLGKVFHKLYAYRSKFLHAGRMASDGNVVRTIPLLSELSETGVKEYGNVAVKIDGKIYSLNISNIREWTTYILRCYYQKRILGRVSFANVFDEGKEITMENFPLQISAVSPEGSKLMKSVFVRTNRSHYILHSSLINIKTKLENLFKKLLNIVCNSLKFRSERK